MVAVALPLAPLAPGAAAAAGTFVTGSVAYVAQQVYGFRAPLPPLPRVGGKAGGPTLKELVADAIAGARVPVALPPNPLGPRGSWAAIGSGVILGLLKKTTAQLWGLFRPSPAGAADPALGPTGPRSTTGRIQISLYSNGAFAGAWASYVRHVTSVLAELRSGPATDYYWYEIGYIGTNNQTYVANGSVFHLSGGRVRFENLEGTVLDPGYQPPPLYPAAVPGTSPEPQALPPPLVPPVPPPAIPQPLVEPEEQPSVVPITPGPTTPPATVPRAPRHSVPLPLPRATPTLDGVIVPQAEPPVPATQPDAHFPVPGAPPVTGNGPRPTPEGIAQELGRLEQKLARLSDPGPEGPGDGSDRLQLLSDLIGRLIEFATSMTSGGSYSLSSPCELDENGNRIVSTVNYPGATNSLGVLGNKIDALAGVLQVHKDLKQPNCKQPAAVGQPVTVNFVQVD